MARKTPRGHPGPGRGIGCRDRTHDCLADQRARSVGFSCHDSDECNFPPTVVERRFVTSLRFQAADFNNDTGGWRQHRFRFGGAETIQLENSASAAKPFQTVRIQGTYRGGEDTTLRVQRLEGGQWLAFPLPAKTDQSGQFTAYVEFGQPGLYQLRVLDPDSDLTSKPSVLMIEG
jgi:hypothetical protein